MSQRRIKAIEHEIEDLRDQIDELEGELEGLREAEDWPDTHTLVAVYGAPFYWPVAPR